ncbi:MAG TPA: hypothetical protein VGW76_12655 [Pyrinomonadaceae bacterium]|nr:hypothetical protein [Pyrinomonadaceae bacterium]
MRLRKVGASVSVGLAISLSLLMAAALFGCSNTNKTLVEGAPAAPVTAANESKAPTKNLPPPELNAVKEAVKRVFKNSAVVDTTRDRGFVAGDFNGDLSQDIAVFVKPDAQRLAEMNEEYPAWMLRDPFGSVKARSPRLRIAVDDVLLAIIHGYGTEGWRDPQATQTFLLKNAAGSALETRSLKEFVAANQSKKLPRLRGDLLAESINEKTGYLYFADATYAWYDPKTFTGEPPMRRGHGDQKVQQ